VLLKSIIEVAIGIPSHATARINGQILGFARASTGRVGTSCERSSPGRRWADPIVELRSARAGVGTFVERAKPSLFACQHDRGAMGMLFRDSG